MNSTDSSEGKFLRGSVYFIVLYEDQSLAVPVVQTLIFSGTRTREDGRIEYLFREIRTRGEEAPFVVQQAHANDLVVDLDGLIERLGSNAKAR